MNAYVGYDDAAVAAWGGIALGRGIDTTLEAIKRAGKGCEQPEVDVSFDGQGSTEGIHAILDVLHRYDVRGIFFPMGEFASRRPDLIDAIKDDGHIVGNHSWDHPYLTRLSPAGIARQITMGERAVAPNSTPKLFRNPHGDGLDSRAINDVLSAFGYQACGWTVDAGDNADPQHPHRCLPEAVAARVLDGEPGVTAAVAPRGVVLMRLDGPHTVEALPMIIDGIRARGMSLPGRQCHWSMTAAVRTATAGAWSSPR